MSISSALQTGVSGLKANSNAVGGISENIANANTVGYKRSFAHMITTTASGGNNSNNGVLSVVAEQANEISKAGGLLSTQSETDLAIAGNGFFIVSENAGETNHEKYLLTRAGSFLPDENGDLVNAAGYYLAGFPYDLDGNLQAVDRSSFASMETVNVGKLSLSASATQTVFVLGNLPSQSTGLATPGAPFVTSSEYYTPLGGIERITLNWQPTSTSNQWDVSLTDNAGAALGSFTMTFTDSGSLSGTPNSYSAVTNLATAPASFALDTTTGIATLSLNNGATPQTVSLEFGGIGSFDGLTQFSGDFSQNFDRDGSSLGELVRSEIDNNGTMYGIFDNGLRRALYEIPLGVVDNPNSLGKRQGNAYQLTGDSGSFQALTATGGRVGLISSSALEASNVDIAQEMTELIKVQRAFSTNASVITTVDEMMEETSRLKR